jgi:hypothetical protein
MANQMPSTAGYGGNIGFDLPGFTQLGGLALLGNLVGLFAWTSIALIVFGYCAALLILESMHGTRPQVNPSVRPSGFVTAGVGLLMCSVLWALVAGVLVGGFEAVTFKTAALVAIGLFSLRTAFYWFGRCLTVFGLIVGVLFSAGLVYAVCECQAPPGSPEEKEKERKGCRVVVTVTDEQHTPIQFAYVDCQWRNEGELAPPVGIKGKPVGDDFSITTNERGAAEHSMIGFNPEGKVGYLDISVYVPTREWYSQDPAPPQYLPARQEMHNILPGERREVSVALTRR